MTREASINLSELGVITPKALVLREDADLAVAVTGYGSDKLLELRFDADRTIPPGVTTFDLVPGTTSVAALSSGALVFADPLLDAWVLANPGSPPRVTFVPSAAERDSELRLGEALFFTTLMAPFNRSDGPLSRFTCETCHFEGYVDGRTHHTGRGDVHAVTKPLARAVQQPPPLLTRARSRSGRRSRSTSFGWPAPRADTTPGSRFRSTKLLGSRTSPPRRRGQTSSRPSSSAAPS